MTLPASDYAGDLKAEEAWSLIKSDPNAQLVDVRTAAEWTFVGLPDLSSLGREVVRVEWQSYPSMAVDPNFVSTTIAALRQVGAASDTPVLYLCRSGGRSRAAAAAMTRSGFTRSYNISGGFEGDPDTERHRGRQNGWKAAGLPWAQS